MQDTLLARTRRHGQACLTKEYFVCTRIKGKCIQIVYLKHKTYQQC